MKEDLTVTKPKIKRKMRRKASALKQDLSKKEIAVIKKLLSKKIKLYTSLLREL